VAEFKVTLTRNVNVGGVLKALQADTTIEDGSRTMASLRGIEWLLLNATELVPDAAREFWAEARRGSVAPHEVQSVLEDRWGLTFGIKDENPVIEMQPVERPVVVRNGDGHMQFNHGNAIPDLNTMLEGHLHLLTERQAILSKQLADCQAEFARNNEDIMRITQVLTTLTPKEVMPEPVTTPAVPTTRGGRKRKDSHAQ
jgi:hypothetical protein